MPLTPIRIDRRAGAARIPRFLKVLKISSVIAYGSEVEGVRVALNTAIEDLPPEYRVAIVLRDVEGFSMREVADALKVTVGNAKSRVHRGRLFLRKRLGMFLGGATIADSASSQQADSRKLFDCQE
jgi:DNA-directed RNA polymerase specialized sigma24 family protein